MRLIPLTKNQVAKVDDEDYEWLMQYKWNVCKAANGLYYARRYDYVGGKRTLWLMARKILKVTDPKILVDHKDRDPLNNQKYNLELSDKSKNAINSDRVDRATGVYYEKARGCWKAFGLRPRLYLGSFQTRELALVVANKYKEHNQ
jgi:hypothetical protein